METPPPQPRLVLAEKVALDLLRREEILKPPVPVHDLLKQFSDVSAYANLSDQSFCCEEHSIWHVCINRWLIQRSLNYTEAHNLGHLLLNHLHFDLSRLTPSQIELLNIEANHFADNLLMPEAWICSACQKMKLNELTAHSLASLFAVTDKTMDYRLHNLGIYSPEDFYNRYRCYKTTRLHFDETPSYPAAQFFQDRNQNCHKH